MQKLWSEEDHIPLLKRDGPSVYQMGSSFPERDEYLMEIMVMLVCHVNGIRARTIIEEKEHGVSVIVYAE